MESLAPSKVRELKSSPPQGLSAQRPSGSKALLDPGFAWGTCRVSAQRLFSTLVLHGIRCILSFQIHSDIGFVWNAQHSGGRFSIHVAGATFCKVYCRLCDVHHPARSVLLLTLVLPLASVFVYLSYSSIIIIIIVFILYFLFLYYYCCCYC